MSALSRCVPVTVDILLRAEELADEVVLFVTIRRSLSYGGRIRSVSALTNSSEGMCASDCR